MKLAAALCAALALASCEEPEVPVGPPRCEPEHEHELDRRLKLAFKALATGDREQARALLQAVLAEEPSHPEAQLGLRLLHGEGIAPSQPGVAPGADGGARAGGAGVIEIAGQPLPVPFAVDAHRWRFEEMKALAPLRNKRDGAGPVYDWFRPRVIEGAPADTFERLVDGLDLIVLHDTHTRTAREAVVELEGGGGSSHFIIDWDGAVYQVLDLALEANHSQRAAIDARSVAIDLVNPVELGATPGLPDGEEDRGVHRPLSEFVSIQGEEVQQWGYTDAQLASLQALVRALGKVLPRIPMAVLGHKRPGPVPRALVDAPGDADLRGVIGHLHVSRRALDPGAGFPWEAFDQALRAP